MKEFVFLIDSENKCFQSVRVCLIIRATSAQLHDQDELVAVLVDLEETDDVAVVERAQDLDLEHYLLDGHAVRTYRARARAQSIKHRSQSSNTPQHTTHSTRVPCVNKCSKRI